MFKEKGGEHSNIPELHTGGLYAVQEDLKQIGEVMREESVEQGKNEGKGSRIDQTVKDGKQKC